MHDAFISHSEKDIDVVLEIARGLEAKGYSTWYYERDNVPGQSYLIQVGRAIEESGCVILIASRASLESPRVTSEVVRAYEGGIPCVPLLLGVTHKEVQARQQVWRQALVTSTSLPIPPGGIKVILPRVIRGLEILGIHPGGFREASRPSGTAGRAVSRGKVPRWLWVVPAALALLVTSLLIALNFGRNPPRLPEEGRTQVTPIAQSPQPVGPADTARETSRAESESTGIEEERTERKVREQPSSPQPSQMLSGSPTRPDFIVLVADSSEDATRILTTALQDKGIGVIGREAINPNLQPYADRALAGNDGEARELARRLNVGAILLGRVRVADVAESYGFFAVRAEIDIRLLDRKSGQPLGHWVASRKAVDASRESAARAAVEGAAFEVVTKLGDMKMNGISKRTP